MSKKVRLAMQTLMSALLALAMVASFAASTVPVASVGAPIAWNAPDTGNPLLPGYFADPSVLHSDGQWFIYATVDPWGADHLAVWSSTDFVNWTWHTLNWPTKAAASSPTSGDSMVWAPSVIHGPDGRYWMYVSVGSEVWVGVADAPLGPWRNALGDKPLIPGNFRPGYHMIDAEVFVDDDGSAYLYWGSGLHWVNGRCFVVRLKPDMVSFDGEPRDVTPAHYFEAPFMAKRNGRYFLMYSAGNTMLDTYQVRYAVGSSPFGPFVEGRNSPILSTEAAREVISPGHHAIVHDGDKDYIVYHRQSLPFTAGQGETLRQVSSDEIRFDGDHIDRVTPSHEGARPGNAVRQRHSFPFVVSASASAGPAHGATAVTDNNYATAWRSAGEHPWIQADLGKSQMIGSIRLRPEYAAQEQHLTVLGSDDGRHWHTMVAEAAYRGSPLQIAVNARTRWLRLQFAAPTGVFEWEISDLKTAP